MKTNRNIHTSSCLQCNPCGSGCTIVDNRISFVFDSEKKHFSHLLFDPTPVAWADAAGLVKQDFAWCRRLNTAPLR